VDGLGTDRMGEVVGYRLVVCGSVVRLVVMLGRRLGLYGGSWIAHRLLRRGAAFDYDDLLRAEPQDTILTSRANGGGAGEEDNNDDGDGDGDCDGTRRGGSGQSCRAVTENPL